MKQFALKDYNTANLPNLSLLYYKSDIKKFNKNVEFLKIFSKFKPACKQIQQRIEYLKCYADACIEMRLVSRMICGIGYTNIMEWGFSFDWTTGLPWLPGSSFKGILLSYIETLIGKPVDDLHGKMKEPVPLLMYPDVKWTYKDIINVFGPQGENILKNEQNSGKVVFLDVYPFDFKGFEIDVISPHYGNYYKEPSKNKPNDTKNPVPLHFLTIKSESKFNFNYKYRLDFNLSKKDMEKQKRHFDNLLKPLIIETGAYCGYGAKTASGYGFFELIKEDNNASQKTFC